VGATLAEALSRVPSFNFGSPVRHTNAHNPSNTHPPLHTLEKDEDVVSYERLAEAGSTGAAEKIQHPCEEGSAAAAATSVWLGKVSGGMTGVREREREEKLERETHAGSTGGEIHLLKALVFEVDAVENIVHLFD